MASDPAHLYSFVQQLESLKVSLPPAPTSVCCSHFEMSHFKSLHNLKVGSNNGVDVYWFPWQLTVYIYMLTTLCMFSVAWQPNLMS